MKACQDELVMQPEEEAVANLSEQDTNRDGSFHIMLEARSEQLTAKCVVG